MKKHRHAHYVIVLVLLASLFCYILLSAPALSTNGDVVLSWARQLGGGGNEVGNSTAIDSTNNVYTTGYFSGTADFDPGEKSYELSAKDSDDIFVSKLDSEGNFVWAESFGGGGADDRGNSIAVDSNDNVYVTGYFSGTVDFDPGDGIFELTSKDSQPDIFILKLSGVDGSLIWAKQIGGEKK